MGILAIIAAIVIVPMMMSNLHNNVANHILFLFSYLALDANNFFDMISYSIGPLVIEYPVALAIFYAALFVIGTVLSKRWFSKHQVALSAQCATAVSFSGDVGESGELPFDSCAL